MKKKGFTLIELLAVIVILAIVALIAVPIVLRVVENARKGAAKASALSYIKAVETYLVASKLDKNAVELKKSQTYNCTKNTVIDSKNYLPINDIVELKGYKPTGLDDYIKLDSTYKVVGGKLTINGYQIEIENGKIKSVVKGEKIKVESISLNYTNETMEKGSAFKLEVTFEPNNASDQRVAYASSDENIVTVSETGLVEAKKNGTAKIIVTSKDDTTKKAECNITVITSATSVSITPNESELELGKTLQLTGTIEPGDVTTNALTWTSSNSSVAHVDENGLVTGMSVGTATIKARTVNGKEATSTITVKEFYTGVSNRTYTANETVTYQGITFQVVKDNGSTVTLVTSSDVSTGQYGSNTTFSSSTAYNYVNTTWVNNNSGIKSEIEHNGIITDTTTNSKVRLLTKDEVSGKTNGTGNAFWTISSSGNDMYYAKPDGTTTYSYVSSSNLASANTITSPTSTSGRVDDSYTTGTKEVYSNGYYNCSDDCDYDCDDVENSARCYRGRASCFERCKSTYPPTTVTAYTLTNTNTKPLGYRPVITVKKK